MNKTNTLQWIFSITTAVVLYAMLALLFVPMKNNHIQNNSNSGKIYMLPISGKLNDKERDLVEWMKLDNPTIFVQPNREFNYSRIIERKYEFSFLNNETSMDFYNNYESNVFRNIKIAKISMPDSLNGEGVVKYELFNQPEIPVLNFNLSQFKTNYPCFIDYYTGQYLNIQFPKSVNIKSVMNKAKPVNYTILEINKANKIGMFPVVKLLQSSGNSELDKLAINSIITQATSDLDFLNSGDGDTFRIVVDWGSQDNKH